MSDRKYIGITIGPILQTLEEAGTPAALWFASSYFSDLTRRICQALTIHMEGIQIYSPYYSETTVDNDGVGKYHDRILLTRQNCGKSSPMSKKIHLRILFLRKKIKAV